MIKTDTVYQMTIDFWVAQYKKKKNNSNDKNNK